MIHVVAPSDLTGNFAFVTGTLRGSVRAFVRGLFLWSRAKNDALFFKVKSKGFGWSDVDH